MSYILFALALFAGITALHSIGKIAVVTFGQKRWLDSGGAFINYGIVAVFGTLSFWLFTVAIDGLAA